MNNLIEILPSVVYGPGMLADAPQDFTEADLPSGILRWRPPPEAGQPQGMNPQGANNVTKRLLRL